MATDTMPRTSGTRRQPPDRATPPPVTAPRHTRPSTKPSTRASTSPSTRPSTRPATRPATGPAAAGRRTRPRAPFILLLVGLLGGALISLLVISTTLAQGSYQITSLQQQDTSLARQEQLLSQQVAQASSPAQIAQEAQQLGMRQNPDLRFIDLKTGKIIAGKVSQAGAAINVPGYSP
jgi:hypothetical protein